MPTGPDNSEVKLLNHGKNNEEEIKQLIINFNKKLIIKEQKEKQKQKEDELEIERIKTLEKEEKMKKRENGE